MVQYFSKALFYKEWKNIRWITIFMTLSLIFFKINPIMAKVDLLKKGRATILSIYGGEHWFNFALLGGENVLFVLAFFVLVIALVLISFQGERQGGTADLLVSMPFTRRQQIFTKWVAGVLALAISFAVALLFLTAFYQFNTRWIIDPYWIIPQWVLLHFLFYLSVFSFLLFVQTVMGQNLAAGVVGVISMMVPWYLLSVIPYYLQVHFNWSYREPVIQTMSSLSGYVFWFELIDARYDWASHIIPYYFYSNFWGKVILMLALIAIFYLLAEKAFRRNALEKNGQLLMFGFLEPVLIWGFALCLGLLFGLFFGRGYSDGSIMAVDVFLVGGTILGYWLAKKTVLFYQR
jgi:ABC-type transport system involved in multi-copper enzyme maturation permease subunit